MADRSAQKRLEEPAGEEQRAAPGEGPGPRPEGSFFQRGAFQGLRAVAELVSFLAVVGTLPFAFVEYHDQRKEDRADRQSKVEADKQQQIDAAKDAYRQVDQRLEDYVKLCLDHPRLDCYSVPQKVDLTPDEVVQQKVLFAMLSDVFENAYAACHRGGGSQEIEKFRDAQWSKWEVYIKKFTGRASYRKVWIEVRDEHQTGFVKYMDGLIPPAAP